MAKQIPIEHLREPLLKCLEETFSNVNGIYLDKGTTLFETLGSVTAEEASEKIGPSSANIAAQVEHLRFYLDVLDEYMRTNDVPKVNWREIWETIDAVTPDEWEKIKTRLRDSHAVVMSTINDLDKWEGSNDVAGGAMSILTHTAYHLGGIRMTLGVIRGKSS